MTVLEAGGAARALMAVGFPPRTRYDPSAPGGWIVYVDAADNDGTELRCETTEDVAWIVEHGKGADRPPLAFPAQPAL